VERKIIGTIVCDAGVVEVLRLLGSIVAHETVDFTVGDSYRTQIFDIAKRIAADKSVCTRHEASNQ
jgi:hypothetical protein